MYKNGKDRAEETLLRLLAMNVADDALLHDLRVRGIKERCRAELNLLSKIEKASMEAKHRCDLVLQILAGDAPGPIEETLRNNEAK
jgi:hypothetical protein